MKKRLFLFFVCIGLVRIALADHITGGEMYYTYIRTNDGTAQYSVTLKLFMRCNSGRQFPDPIYISAFNKKTFIRVAEFTSAITSRETLSLNNTDPCITNPPPVCYEVAYYTFTVNLPISADGYTLAAQVNYRIDGIANLQNGYNRIGATYSTEIPGTGVRTDAPMNNSARFTANDLVVVCSNNSFSYSFAAVDGDGDRLRYSFCYGYTSGTNGSAGANSSPSSPPPYPSLPYGEPEFSGNSPLGPNVTIDPDNGLITGIAPGEGPYVVTVCVDEIRNGTVIATQRKDIQINITSCSVAAATLLPVYSLCKNSQTISISGLSNSPLIKTYNWEIFDKSNAVLQSSTNTSVMYTFKDTGTYYVKLVVNRDITCSDSITSKILVYPGMKTQFDVNSLCIQKPTSFVSTSTTTYGSINGWQWDFGELTLQNDKSDLPNPTYTYPIPGNKNVILTVFNTNGCSDSTLKQIRIIDKPAIDLAFRDTLICINDQVQLNAAGTGVFSWTPNANITNINTPNPTVSPPATATYFVHLDDNGCVNDDSVQVRVVDHVTLRAMNDTTICESDPVQLRLTSDGLQYSWSPPETLNNSFVANPTATPVSTMIYTVTAVIGSCSATDQVRVTAIPYPVVDAGPDTLICYDTPAQLQGFTNGNVFTWSPAVSLDDETRLDPVAHPEDNTTYILTALNTQSGCPKPSYDSVVVTVLPDIHAFAGRDTAITINQPLQLNASGGVAYSWQPPNYLSDPFIADPVGIYSTPSEGIRYKVLVFNEAGCTDSAYITVKVFATPPTVFVPTGFTPNGDGRNDILRPIAVGMKQIEYFQVFNRWGQRVFSTQINGTGWDGTINGQPQASNTYVWIVKAVDYNGNAYFERGITTLIR